MKRTISLVLAIMMVMSLICIPVSAASIDLSAYAVEGLYNMQIHNNWSDGPTRTTTTDETTGIKTTTSTYSGDLAANKRVATFPVWAKNEPTYTAAEGAYTMHFGFTVNEISDPIYLAYRFNADKKLISLSDSKVVVGGSIDGTSYISVTEPYTVDMFMNVETLQGYIYVNDQLLYQGGMNNDSSDTYWTEVRVFSSAASTDFKLVTTAANYSIYNEELTITDVMDAYLSNNTQDETDNVLYSGVKYMPAYALSGYNNKKIDNNWANITLTDSVASDGVITTTATYSGTLAAGKRVASFQPWAKNEPTYSEAAGAYTMHFGFTVNEISDPVCLAYRFNVDKKLISFSDSKVVWGSSMDGSTFIEVTAPYTIDIFMNIQNCKGIIFVNGEVLYDGTITNGSRFCNSTADTYWTEVRVTNISAATDFKLVTTGATTSIFNDEVIFENVVDYVMNRDSAAKTNWLWQIDGMHAGHELMHGAIDGICSVTGNNTDGYVLQPTLINANNYGFARFFLATESGKALPTTTDDSVLWQTFEYNPTTLTDGQRIGIRGNDGYLTLITAYPATNSASAYLSVGGNEIPVSSDEFYKIDFIVNNKDYEYYILIDGKVVDHGTIYSERQPLWNMFYSSYTTSEKMTLKNVKTTLYDSTVTMDTVVNTLRVRLAAPFATDTNGYGDFEVENYECYDAESWRLSESIKFSGGKALAVIAENKTTPYNTEDPTMNLSFTANKSGENTYYMWIRHTASVANQSGQNCFLSLTEDGSYGRLTFTAEQNAPQWICLGSVTVSEGENGYVRVRERQQNHIAFDRYVITTDADFVPTDAYYAISPAYNSTAVYATADSNGRFSLEAENTTYTSPYSSYTSTFFGTYGSATNYSNSKGISVSSDESVTFSSSSATEPDIEFNFTPTTDGSKYLWARIYSTSTNKDIAISVNCSSYKQFSPNVQDELYWQLIYVIDNACAGLPVNVRMYNVAGGYAIDKFAISESVFDTPSGKSDWTTTDSELPGTYTPTVTASEVTELSHPRIYFNADEVATVKAAFDNAENAAALTEHDANVTRGKNKNFTGALAVSPGVANNSSYLLGAIEALALEYAINGDTSAGNKAVSSVVNYVKTVSYAGIDSENLPRVAGHDIATIAKIYDWCYSLFTDEQKTAIIDRCIELAYQFDLGWPPENLSAVTGFGAEGSLQNYLLTFAIAVADERDDIYNYVVGRIEDEYAPARKIMYESGAALQGSRYGTYRGQHDLTAVLLLNSIGYDKDIYGEGLKDLVNWYIYMRRPDGLLFMDGDDTNNGKTAGEYYTVGHMQNAFVVAARLFEDPYIKNEAKKAMQDFTTFEYGESYISPSSFLAINRPSITTEEENGYPLSKFFGNVGTLIARTGWTDEASVTDSTAVAYMKTGEVNVSNHQHLDAGNFQLYYKGILANDPVYYSNYSSEYMNLYAKRSVAHNTVLVRDGVSRDLNGHSIADGGQVPITAPDTASEISTVATTEAYDFGGDDVNQPDYNYLKADLTGAYSSDSVSDYNRSFMFMNMYDEESPAALVVFDRLNTNDAGDETAWLLHGLNTPEVSGSRSTFSLNENGYTGKMTNDTLLPANPTITTVEDGYVTSGGTKYSSGYDTSAEGVNESDGYRIEVSPSSQSTLTYYLNVIQLSDSDAEVVTPTLIENDTFVGALVKDRVALFSKSGDLIGADTSTSYSFNFADDSGYVCKIAVADVTEGTWEISYSEDGSEYKVMATASTNRFGEDKGATISFDGMPGYYKMTRVSGDYVSKTTEISSENVIKQLSPSVKHMDNALYVAPRTYTSMSGVSAGEYNYTQVIAVYKEGKKDTLAVKELIAFKVIDNFSQTDKFGDYSEIVGLDELPEDVVVKTFLFEDLSTIKPITDASTVTYY